MVSAVAVLLVWRAYQTADLTLMLTFELPLVSGTGAMKYKVLFKQQRKLKSYMPVAYESCCNVPY